MSEEINMDLASGIAAFEGKHFSTAANLLAPLADNGDAEAQYNLGVMYDEGTSVEQDLGKAAEWYRKAAEQGFVDAQANLGLMYFHGQGVSQDYQAAAHWLNLAVANGDTEAADILKQIQDAAAPQPEPA